MKDIEALKKHLVAEIHKKDSFIPESLMPADEKLKLERAIVETVVKHILESSGVDEALMSKEDKLRKMRAVQADLERELEAMRRHAKRRFAAYERRLAALVKAKAELKQQQTE